MNSMQLKDKLKNISKEKNVDFNLLLRLYMYDRFLERQQKKHFIKENIMETHMKLQKLLKIVVY